MTTYAEALELAAATSINGVAGHLVTVETEDEDNFLRAHYATAAVGATGGIWLSASDASTEGTWAWTSGNLNTLVFWQGNAVEYDSFDIVWDHFSRVVQLHPTLSDLYVPCAALYLVRMLIGC